MMEQQLNSEMQETPQEHVCGQTWKTQGMPPPPPESEGDEEPRDLEQNPLRSMSTGIFRVNLSAHELIFLHVCLKIFWNGVESFRSTFRLLRMPLHSVRHAADSQAAVPTRIGLGNKSITSSLEACCGSAPLLLSQPWSAFTLRS